MHWTLKAFEDLTATELYALLAARQEIFVVEQKCAYLDADGADEHALHLWAHDDTTPVLAYLRAFGPGIKWLEASIGRVLTTRDARGRGLGRDLMRRGIELVGERWAGAPIRIGAQRHLAHFYAELGFVIASADYLEDGIPHVEMLRA